jgi:hypothetical protein
MALAGEAPRVARRMAEMILLIYMVFDVYLNFGKHYGAEVRSWFLFGMYCGQVGSTSFH